MPMMDLLPALANNKPLSRTAGEGARGEAEGG
jgi:hypothetical protein